MLAAVLLVEVVSSTMNDISMDHIVLKKVLAVCRFLSPLGTSRHALWTGLLI